VPASCLLDGEDEAAIAVAWRSGGWFASAIRVCVASALVGGMSVARADPIDGKAALCGACHGQSGVPANKETPIIWGQQEGYLYLQLRDYKSGARSNEIMSHLVSAMTRDDMLAFAAYFAAKPWPNVGQPSANDAAAKEATSASASIGCPACHSDRFQGDGTVPRAAGQYSAYIAKTLQDFRTGARANNPGMTDLMKAVSDADIVALSKYLAGL
jgi:cytochrome c553